MKLAESQDKVCRGQRAELAKTLSLCCHGAAGPTGPYDRTEKRPQDWLAGWKGVKKIRQILQHLGFWITFYKATHTKK